MVLVLGIDEAGRGPVIGPMVICGYLIESDKLNLLKELGVRDSKELSPERRVKLVKKLKHLARDYALMKLSAKEIDELRDEKNLNKIEMEKFAELINVFTPDVAIVDAPQVNTRRFKNELRRLLNVEGVKLIVENYADKKYVAVSAASILAKVARDREIEKIKRRVGYDFGTGYPHDPATIEFLKLLLKRYKRFPDYVRSSWITAKSLLAQNEQRKLKDFLD